jgi:hypothetical protein
MNVQATSPMVAAATIEATGSAQPGERAGGWGRFARHLIEMTIAMMPGCLAGCALRSLLAGSWVDTSGLTALLMALMMSLTMGAWMRYRGHGWRCVVEMSAAMFVAPVLLLPVLLMGGISASTLIAIENAAMVPAMLAVMLYRRAAYIG